MIQLPSNSAGPGPDIMASVSALFASSPASTSSSSGGVVFRSPPLLRGDLLPPAEELCRLLQHRRGKGGRQPASDPRLDPRIDSKKAKRILANRQSAARSKMKQKAFMDRLRAQQTLLKYQKDAVARELGQLAVMCKQMEDENDGMLAKIQALSGQYRIQGVLFAKLCEQRNKLLADVVKNGAAAGAPASPLADHASPPATPSTGTAPAQPVPLAAARPQGLLPLLSLLPPPPTTAPAAAKLQQHIPAMPPVATAATAGPMWPVDVAMGAAHSSLAAALQTAALPALGNPAAAAVHPLNGTASHDPALWQALGMHATAAAAAADPAAPAASLQAPDVAMGTAPAHGRQGDALPAAPAAASTAQAAAAHRMACAPAPESGACMGQAPAAAAAAAALASTGTATGPPGAAAMHRNCNQLLPPHLAGQRLALPCA